MWQAVRTPLLTVLFVFVGLFLFIKLIGSVPFSVNSVSSVKESMFTVQGTGEVTAIPDTALLSLGVSKTAPSVQAAQDQVNGIINKITTDLKALGVEEKDIKTVNYSVNPNYDYTGGSQRINGYIVNADLQVRMKPIDKANEAIDIATKDGATNVGNVQFVIDDKKRKELEEQARKVAIDEAKAKAQSISKVSGIRLGRLIDVQEVGGNNYPQPMAYDSMKLETANRAGGAVEVPPTELNPGENKVTSNVTLSYETL
jgi:uncharacterized protein YggE